VKFVFDNINLPVSTTDEEGSKGFIAFKIKPKSDVAVGDVISGVADIYFVFNLAIITNTVKTEIVEPLSVNEFNLNLIMLFPNPEQDIVRVSSKVLIDRIAITDMNGRQLQSIKVSNTSYSADVSGLSNGLYFLEILSDGQKSTKKLLKN